MPCLASTHRAPRGTSSGLTSLALRRCAGLPTGQRGQVVERRALGVVCRRRPPGEGVERQAQAPSASRRGPGRGGRGATSSGSSPKRALLSSGPSVVGVTGCSGITQPTGSPAALVVERGERS